MLEVTHTVRAKFDKLLDIVRKNPGLDAIALKGKGFRPQNHGSLRDAEKLYGLIEYRNGGWYVKEVQHA